MSRRNRRHMGIALSLVIALLSFFLTLSILSCDLSLEGRGSNVTLKFLVHGASSTSASTQTGSKLILPTVNSLTVTLTPQSEGLSSPEPKAVTITPGEKSVPVTFPDIIVGLYEIKAEATSSGVTLFHQSATMVIGTGKAITLNLVPTNPTTVAVATPSLLININANSSQTYFIPAGSALRSGAGIRVSGLYCVYLQTSDGRLVDEDENSLPSATTATVSTAGAPSNEGLYLTVYNKGGAVLGLSLDPVYSITYIANNAKVGTAPVDGKLYAFGETIFSATPPSGGNLGGDEVIVGTGIRQRPHWYTSPSGETEIAFPLTFGFSSNLKLYDAQYTTDNSVIGKIGPAGGWIFYDQGEYTTYGWRYLEAAPYDQSSNMVLYPYWPDSDLLSVTSTAIGTGKGNTDALVSHGGISSSYAARLCDSLSLNGFADWFLPSRDELNQLYTVYITAGWGGFGINVTGSGDAAMYQRYWSSSMDDSSSYSTISPADAYFVNFVIVESDFEQFYDNGVFHPVRAVRRF